MDCLAKSCAILDEGFQSRVLSISHLVVVVPVDEDGPLGAVGDDAGEVDRRAAVHVDLRCVENPRLGHCVGEIGRRGREAGVG